MIAHSRLPAADRPAAFSSAAPSGTPAAGRGRRGQAVALAVFLLVYVGLMAVILAPRGSLVHDPSVVSAQR